MFEFAQICGLAYPYSHPQLVIIRFALIQENISIDTHATQHRPPIFFANTQILPLEHHRPRSKIPLASINYSQVDPSLGLPEMNITISAGFLERTNECMTACVHIYGMETIYIYELAN
jgi:hypothetical protein